MNSKDLNSINEAFATARAKVVAEDSKTDETPIIENTETVNEIAPAVAAGIGAAARLAGMAVARKAGKAAINKLKNKDEEEENPEEDVNNPHAYDDIADDEKVVGTTVEIAADAPAGAGQSGQIIEVRPDTNTVVVATTEGEVEVDKNDVWPTGDDDPSEVPTLDFDSVRNIMDEYESRLSSNYRVKNVREKSEDGESFKQPDEKVSEVDSKTQRPKGEVKADEKSEDVGDVKKDLQEPVEEEEKDDKKVKKEAKESINNCNKGYIMSEDKSIFDKLYEQVMNEDEDFGELGLPTDDGLDIGDELGDEGGEEVTVTLTPDQADAIRAVADQLAPVDDELGDEEPGDEVPTDEPEESFEGVEEDVTPTTGKPTSDGTKPGVDPSDGGGKTTDPAADSLGGKSSGTGDAKVTDDAASTGKPTTDGKKPGVAKGSGKPGSQKAKSTT